MASNKHHELAKLVMAQVSDLLTDYPVRQTNSFVNAAGIFPKIVKFDYLGQYSLKGTTRLIVTAGLEIAADYTYFNTGYTWRNAKRKYYTTNFGRYRNNLVPHSDESFFGKAYTLIIKANGQVDVELIRHELTYFFLPYLERMNTVDDLVTYLHGHKPTEEELRWAYRHHSYFYNWLISCYLLLAEGRNGEAEFCIGKINHIAYLLDQSNPDSQFSEGLFVTVSKFQKDFNLRYSYRYDAFLKRIIIE